MSRGRGSRTLARRPCLQQPERDPADALAAHPILAVLEPDERARLLAAGVSRRFRPGRTILKEGDPPAEVFFLLEGAVRVFHRSPDGKTEVLVKLFRAPALFGEMEVLVGRPFLEHVKTLEPTVVLAIAAPAFVRAVRASPEFSRALTVDLAARLCIATCNERALAFCVLDARLANLLLDYAALCGEPTSDGRVRLAAKLSQEGLARDLAVSRRALGLALDKLKRDRVLAKEQGRYVIARGELSRRASANLGLFYRSDVGPETTRAGGPVAK